MTVALAQMFCSWGDRARNLAKMEAFSNEAAQGGARLIVFPELTVPGIYKSPASQDAAESPEGESVSFMRRLCRTLHLAAGFGFLESGSSLPYNTYCVIDDDGTVVVQYRKSFIPPLERPFWQAGNERPIFPLFGRQAAVATCWDATREELLEHYHAMGVELLLSPHAWDADPLDSRGAILEYEEMSRLAEMGDSGTIAGWRSHDSMKSQFYSYIPLYSGRYHFTTFFVNQTGKPHPLVNFVGPTFAVGNDGEVIAETHDDSEGLVYVELS